MKWKPNQKIKEIKIKKEFGSEKLKKYVQNTQT